MPVDNWVTLVLLVATLYLAQLRIRDAASPVGGYSRAFSSGTRTLTNPAQDIAAEYPGLASIPPPCVGLNGCEGAGTGRPPPPQ